MKKPLLWLFAGFLGFLGAGPALLAQNLALNQPLTALARPSAGLVGLSPAGALLRSTNNGSSFATVRAADTPRALYAVAASGSTLVAMGDAAYFVRSTDDGATWSSLASALTPAHVGPIHGLAANGSSWVAVGQRGVNLSVLRSANSGVAWTSATVPVAAGALHGVAWTGSRWVAVGGDGIFGFIYTSTDGASWTRLTSTDYPLYAVASNGAGKVVAVGDAGTVLYASDGGATAGSFVSHGGNLVSEALRSVAFLSGDNWIVGGDNLALVAFDSSALTASLVSAPSSTSTTAYLALASTGAGSAYYYAPSDGVAPPEPEGPISLQVSVVEGQLRLTLVGAQNGYGYYLQSSSDLSAWATVSGSAITYSAGAPAPTWAYPLPSGGGRVFYRAVVASF